jgi:pimeloyl-ACP methyl ester carboxylesterase
MEQTVSLPDGRQLRIEVAGAAGGEVVLVHHGTPGSRLLFPSHVADAAARGVRLVGYDRAGYGGSTRRHGRSVADVVGDMRAIAGALGVDRVVTWGISGGGPHALACAALAPDLVVAAASLASVAPYDASGLDFFSGMGDLNIEDIRLSIDDPGAFQAKAGADCEELLAAKPEDLLVQWESLLSDVDAKVVTGDLATHLLDEMHEGVARGADGYIDDSFAFVRSWGFEPADIRVPVLLWQGRQDRFVPFGHGEWLARQIPGVEAHLSDDDGHLTLLDKVGDVHGWLLGQRRDS